MKQIFRSLLAFVVFVMLISMISCAMYMPDGSKHESGDTGDGYYDAGPTFNGSASTEKGESGSTGDTPMSPDEEMAGAAEDDGEAEPDMPDEEEPAKPEKEENVKLPGGMITAGAWNDNDYYKMWLELFSQDEEEKGKFFDFTNPDLSWGFNSQKRVKVYAFNGEAPVAGATVVAYDEQGNSLYSAVTDAHGNAYLFPEAENGSVSITNGEETVSAEFTADERSLSVELSSPDNKLNVIEIMLVVDVTGSMGDEISFLKAELADVINRIAENDSETVIRLAMLFYRDTEDRVPFDYYDFAEVTTAEGLASQQVALNAQKASGGGDYPEAVDEAMDIAVNKQWSTGTTTKIIFHVLDAPAHDGKQYQEKLVNATKIAAEKGIRICPIICSGAAEVTEYTMREAAIYTGGTFIFVTDDSGIGGSHHDPDIPNVTVELLNSLMVRIVNGYHTGEFSDPIYWKQDPNLNVQ